MVAVALPVMGLCFKLIDTVRVPASVTFLALAGPRVRRFSFSVQTFMCRLLPLRDEYR